MNCGLAVIREIIAGKWKPCLLNNIADGIRRPGDLQRHNPTATRRVLNQQLKELEEDGIVRRVIYAEVPPKVEYYLTEKGESLMQVIYSMEQWGAQYVGTHKARHSVYEAV